MAVIERWPQSEAWNSEFPHLFNLQKFVCLDSKYSIFVIKVKNHLTQPCLEYHGLVG